MANAATADAEDSVADERAAWVVLGSTDGVGPVTFARLVAALGTARRVLAEAGARDGRARLAELRDERGSIAPGDTASAIRTAATEEIELLASLDAAGVHAVTPLDTDYPSRLRRIDLPPPVLFARGDLRALEENPSVAIVGTRRPSVNGRRVATRIADAVAACGARIVSGLALGIDGAAHAAAVASGAPTVAVIGGGHDRLYPAGHRTLVERILAGGGAVVSEHPPRRSPSRGTFPRRNRVISGLADAVIVVEAGARSGALTTAAWALEQGRPLFLVPGSIDAPEAAGCLAFLREYPGEARIVAGIAELLDDLAELEVLKLPAVAGPDGHGAGSRANGARTTLFGPSLGARLAELGRSERSVAMSLAGGARSVDELVLATAFAPATVLGSLTLLELRGLVEPALGRYRLAGDMPASAARRDARPAARLRRSVGAPALEAAEGGP